MEHAGCSVPDDLRVDLAAGVWLREEPDGEVTLGLLAPFAAFAGRLTTFLFRPPEVSVAAGRSVATIESARLTAPVRCPVDAALLRQNLALPDRPRQVNDAPYGDGWIVRVRPRDVTSPRSLPTAREAADALRRQIEERRVRCYAALPDLEIVEIGSECRAILARLDDELARRPAGDVVLLVADDPTAPLEMVRWSDRTGYPILERRSEGGLWRFLVRKVAAPVPRRRSGGDGEIRP